MNKRPEKLQNVLIGKNHLQITLRVLAITVVTIGAFAGVGYLVDTQLDSKPIAMVIGLVLGFPVTQYIIYKKFRNFTDDLK